MLVLLCVTANAYAIVNGAATSDEIFNRRFPWAVALESPDSGGVCTAELISPTWVLTAAHCTSADLRVLVGHADRRLARQVSIRSVQRHPKFDAASGQFDVGLIELTEPVVHSPLALATRIEARALLKPSAKGIIAGWGHRSSRGGYSERLVVSDVELRGLEWDKSRLGYTDPISGPCGGDSGGPLVMARADGRPVLLGVASRTGGNLCAQGGGVGIYVDVSQVRDFIAQHVRDLPL